MTLAAFAAEHWRLQHGARSYRSISAADAGAQHQTRRSPLLLSIDGTDRRTDLTPHTGSVSQLREHQKFGYTMNKYHSFHFTQYLRTHHNTLA